jgi:hypothetical protein
MDRTSLLRLASSGLAQFPPSRLPELAAWCWDIGVASADSRCLILWKLLSDLGIAFEQFDGLPTAAVDAIDRLLATNLPELMSAELEVGSHLANSLRLQIMEQLTSND